MRLTLLGGLFFGLVALGSGYQLVRAIEHGEWISGVLAVVMLLLWALPILRGRVPLEDVPTASSWVVRTGLAEPPMDPGHSTEAP